MANHKSAEKRHRQSVKRRIRNRAARSEVRTAVKKARSAVAAEGPVPAEVLRAAESALAKAGGKGLFHRKNVSRRISRLAKAAAKKTAS